MHSVTDRQTYRQTDNRMMPIVTVRSAKKVPVVKLDINVINASLTQNQCLQFVNAAHNAC